MSSVDQAGGEVTFVDRGLKNGFGNQAAGVVGSGGEASSRPGDQPAGDEPKTTNSISSRRLHASRSA